MIIFPRGCAGCGQRDEVLCAQCSQLFDCRIEREIAHSFMVFSCAYYDKEVREALLSWKDHNDEELDDEFGPVMARRCINELKNYMWDVVDTNRMRELCVIPVPSSPQSLRRRGRVHMKPLCTYIVRAINQYAHVQGLYIHAHVCSSLSIDKRVHKAVTDSGRRARLKRLDKRLALRSCRAGGISREAILVDDIVTTGATLRSCVRVLRSAGIEIVGAFALADAHVETVPY